MERNEAYESAKRVVQARRGLYGHALVYAIVNSVLFVLDYLTPGGPWFYWPLFGWGIALLINAVVVMTGLTPGSEGEERAIQNYLKAHPR